MPILQYVVPILFLALLETLLSIDNAIVLAMLARHLPTQQQKKALTYGLVGSVVFRLLALVAAQALLKWHFIKLIGGGYLLYVAFKHLLTLDSNGTEGDDESTPQGRTGRSFWHTVILIELMDVAFAVDSILAAVAVSKNLWIIFLGGMLGVMMIRIAAGSFIRLLDRFPGLEVASYILILIIGSKLTLEYFELPHLEFEKPGHPAFLAFWVSMLVVFASGFFIKKRPATAEK